MDPFDIMTTATLRPELLKRTFDSFIENLFGDDIKKASLCLNIDKAGADPKEHAKKIDEILDYIGELPFKDLIINIPVSPPSFSRAFYWCLGQIGTGQLTFNLEEDWELTRKIDFRGMVQAFKEDTTLAHLRLSSFNSPEKHQLKTWNKFCKWNGKYYEVPKHLRGTIGWAGHPSLNRTSFMMCCATTIDPERNPEKQIKGQLPQILKSRFGVWQEQEETASIRDLGRSWMVKNGYQKSGNKAFFTNWEKVEVKS